MMITADNNLHDPDASSAQSTLEKWGDALGAGFQSVPDALIKNQKKLGLSPTDLSVLLNITMHWWYADRPPYPGTGSIARRIGVSPRTVQRSIKRMIALGLLRQMGASEGPDGEAAYDMNGLVVMLEELARNDLYFRGQKTTS